MQEGKSLPISTMRVLAMLMIIAFHSMLFYTGKWWQFDGPAIPLWMKVSEFFNTIDLPMFVFISGFLFSYLYINKNKYRDKEKFLQGKARRLLVPYLFWGVFQILLMPSLNRWENLLTGISHLWFLLMLFEIFIVAICIAHFLCFKASIAQWAFVFVGAFLLFFLFHKFSSHRFFLCIHAVLFYLPAFLLGMCCARFRLQERIPPTYATALLLMAFVLLAVYLFFCSPFPFFAEYFILLITGYTIIVSFFVLLRKISIGKIATGFIAHFDRLSIGIYIFNQIIINTFLQLHGVITMLREHYYWGVPIIFLVGLVIPWLLSLLFNQFKLLKWTIG